MHVSPAGHHTADAQNAPSVSGSAQRPATHWPSHSRPNDGTTWRHTSPVRLGRHRPASHTPAAHSSRQASPSMGSATQRPSAHSKPHGHTVSSPSHADPGAAMARQAPSSQRAPRAQSSRRLLHSPPTGTSRAHSRRDKSQNKPSPHDASSVHDVPAGSVPHRSSTQCGLGGGQCEELEQRLPSLRCGSRQLPSTQTALCAHGTERHDSPTSAGGTQVPSTHTPSSSHRSKPSHAPPSGIERAVRQKPSRQETGGSSSPETQRVGSGQGSPRRAEGTHTKRVVVSPRSLQSAPSSHWPLPTHDSPIARRGWHVEHASGSQKDPDPHVVPSDAFAHGASRSPRPTITRPGQPTAKRSQPLSMTSRQRRARARSTVTSRCGVHASRSASREAGWHRSESPRPRHSVSQRIACSQTASLSSARKSSAPSGSRELAQPMLSSASDIAKERIARR